MMRTTLVLFAVTLMAGPAAVAEALQPGNGSLSRPQSAGAPAGGPAAVVEAQFEAFNAGDVEAMVANLSEDFAWYAVDGEAATLQVRGRDAFRRSMDEYFAGIAGTRSEIESMVVVGNYVSVKERAYWLADGEERSQASLAVYEVVDGRIQRVWYYPAVE